MVVAEQVLPVTLLDKGQPVRPIIPQSLTKGQVLTVQLPDQSVHLIPQ